MHILTKVAAAYLIQIKDSGANATFATSFLRPIRAKMVRFK